MATHHLSLLGMFWAMIRPMVEVQAQRTSAITFRMTFLDINEVNSGKLRLIVNVSFQVNHTSTATISLRSPCSPLHSSHCHLVFFIFIMFSSALNQWMLCTPIVISQDTANFSAGGSSRLHPAIISINA
jgi:hypothetical protein